MMERIMIKADDNLPEPDHLILQQAYATASAADREPDYEVRKRLEEQALELRRLAHQARRAAMCQRGRQ
jgi:hypothetical protein